MVTNHLQVSFKKDLPKDNLFHLKLSLRVLLFKLEEFGSVSSEFTCDITILLSSYLQSYMYLGTRKLYQQNFSTHYR